MDFSNIQLTPSQQQIVDSDAQIVFVSVGAGAGTSTLQRWLYDNAGASILTSRTTTAFRGVGSPFEEVFKTSKPPRVYTLETFAKYNEQSPTILILDNICNEGFNKDIFKSIKCKVTKLYIFTRPIDDKKHPFYRVMQELLVGKTWFALNNGFPYLACDPDSIRDVLGVDPLKIELFRTTYETNTHLRKACPDYEVHLEQLNYKDRMKFKHGLWNFEYKS